MSGFYCLTVQTAPALEKQRGMGLGFQDQRNRDKQYRVCDKAASGALRGPPRLKG